MSCSGTILHLDQPFLKKLIKEAKQVARAALGLNVIFTSDGILDFGYRSGFLHQVPDARSHRVEAIIDPVFYVEDGGFPGKVAGYLVLDRDNDGAIGDGCAH
jgi:hypothetical protein